jgi:SAM-dependent methyltransferase
MTHEDARLPHKREKLAAIMGGYRKACVLSAAAELKIFAPILDTALTSEQIAHQLGVDARALTYLLDALCGLGFLIKEHGSYRVDPEVKDLLDESHEGSMIPMMLHSGSVMRSWTQLARVVATGRPQPREASIRGDEADRAAFIGAMHAINAAVAEPFITDLLAKHRLPFTHLLDVGGASGTWTLAFLKHNSSAEATIFDLPHAIRQAEQRVKSSPCAGRIQLAAGDFNCDPLPEGCDLAWVSAIIHMHDRAANCGLYRNIFNALKPGGTILIRDFVMESDHIHPVDGALFAINMLVNTEGGGCFTFEEISADLTSCGFTEVKLLNKTDTMNGVVAAIKPA